jgi:transposase InsO family protein
LAVDHFTKFAFGRSIAFKEASRVEHVLREMFAELPVPEKALSDNGSEFRNHVVAALMAQNDVTFMHGRPYHKTTNGGAERLNKTVARMVRPL